MGKNHVRAVMLPRWQETTPFRRPAVGGSAAAARPSAPGWRPLRGLLLAYAVAVWVLVMAQGGAPAVAMAASAPAATVVAATPAAAATSASATGTVYGVVTDDNGHAVPAQVRFVSAEKGLLVTSYTGWLGAYSVNLPPGRYTLEVSRGPEYSVTTRSVQVVAGQKTQADATLSQLYAPGNLGWYGGDTHLHSTYSDGSQAVEDVARACVANGLAWAALTDHNTIAGHKEWLAARGMDGFLAIPGEEVTTSLGHFNAIGIRSLVNWQPAATPTDLTRICSDTTRQAGVIIVNHPYAAGQMGFRNWDVLGQFNALEIWNGGCAPNLPGMGNAESLEQWFNLLNGGQRIPGVAGSDCHDATGGPYGALAFAPLDQALAVLAASADPAKTQFVKANEAKLRAWVKAGLYPGNPRTYVHVAKLTEFNVLRALARGNSFVTNGPLVLADIGGKIPGETFSVAGGAKPVLNIKVLSNRPLLQVKVIQGGKTVREEDAAGQMDYEAQVELDPADGGWVVVEAFGAYPYFAVTNPIYLSLDPQIAPMVKITGPDGQNIWNGPVQLVGQKPTVMDALSAACLATGASWHQNAGFVDEIGGFAMAKDAGWMYKVNGQIPDVGAADYVLKDGDQVEWYWTQWSR